MRDFSGKVAVITGGAGGVGRALGVRLARAGAKVALWDLDEARLSRAVGELGSSARGYALDASDPAQVRDAARKVESELGPVDFLDNNVGVVFPGSFLDFTEERIHKTVDVNLKSYLWCTRAFLPGMIARGCGHIVMTASAAGLSGVPGMTVYSATKHAVVGFAESLRLELRNSGIDGIGMTIVCPSFIASGMFEGANPPLGTGWLTVDRIADEILAAVRSGRLYVREPFLVKLIPLLKALPVRCSDWAGDLTGMHRSLEPFNRKDEPLG